MYEKIRDLCAKRGLSIRKLEIDCNLSHGSLSKWDKHKPSFDRIQNVADYLGVPVDFLLSEKSDTSPDAVQNSAQPVWYTDPDAAKLAEQYFTDPSYRILFDAAQGSTADDLMLAAEMLKRLKESRGD